MEYKIIAYEDLENFVGKTVKYIEAESFEEARDKFFENYLRHEIDEIIECEKEP